MTDDRILAEALRRIWDLEKRVRLLECREGQRADASTHATMVVYDLAKEAHRLFGVKPDAIYGGDKRHAYVRARQWVMFEARARKLSLSEIGDALGRDHTTIFAGVKAEQSRRKPLPDNENSTKIERAEKGRQPQSGSDHTRDCEGVRDAG